MSEVRADCQACDGEKCVTFDLGFASALGGQPLMNHAACSICDARHARNVETGAVYLRSDDDTVQFIDAEIARIEVTPGTVAVEIKSQAPSREISETLPTSTTVLIYPRGEGGEVMAQVLDAAGTVLAFGVGESEDDAILGISDDLRHKPNAD